MDEQVRKFNIKIHELIAMIEADLPKDDKVITLVESAKRAIKCAITIDRTYIIEESVPQLLKYRDVIAENRIEELIFKSWDDTINNNADALKDAVDKNSIDYMIELLRNIWKHYDDEQKMFIKKSLKSLLSYSIKYSKAKLQK